MTGSKRAEAEGRAKEPEISRNHPANRGGGRRTKLLGLGRRAARVAPARTVFVVPAVDGGFRGESEKINSQQTVPVFGEKMASNREEEEIQEEERMEVMEAELSLEHDGER